MILKNLASLIFRISGWTITGTYPPGLKKCIVVTAPHTSMWDFVWGRLFFLIIGVPVKLLIKSKYFFFPLGPVLRFFGAIPVSASKDKGFYKGIVDEINKTDYFHLVITPEGTRKYTKRWRLGFYYIAKEAGIPIQFGWLDYRRKQIGVGPLFYPTDDQKADMEYIMKFYKAEWAKYPAKFYELP
jgi:1-acyl-sn-glycerol-3-phosphate acyltransferase